jgi:hypothetical protein
MLPERQGFREKYRSPPGEDDFFRNRLRLDLAVRQEAYANFAL